MKIKIFTLMAFLLAFGVLISSYAYASASEFDGSTDRFDVSIDRVRVNGAALAESRTNLIADADIFSVVVDFTTLAALEKAHVEAILRGRQTGDVVSNFTSTFNLAKNQSSTAALTLVLIDKLKREKEFDLTIKIADARGNSEQKTYGIKTRQTVSGRSLDVSIDRVKINDKVVAASRTNFIDESNDFDVLVELTTLEDLKDAHLEAILRDLKSGVVIADASPNFDLRGSLSSSKLLRLQLLDKLKQSSSFELTVRIIDAEGNSIQQLYGIQMRDNGITNARGLDISIDSVEAVSKFIAEDENNFVTIGDNEKKLGLTVRLTSLENIKNAHVDAILTFESGDSVSDATAVFDLAKEQHAIKKLELPLIGKFGQGNFGLKLKIVNADGDSKERSYNLKLSHNNIPFVISGISLTPETNAEAGKNIEAVLSLRNIGVVPLESVSAKLSIPELGVSSAKIISIKNNKFSEIKEDFMLKIPDNAEAGDYTVRSEIASQFGDTIDVKEVPISILGKREQASQDVINKITITVPVSKQDIYNDGSEVIYPITIKNDGTNTNTYTLLLDGMNWADLRLSESNVFILKPKESKTINIYASSRTSTEGEKTFVVTIKDSSKALKQIPLNGDIIAAEQVSSNGFLWIILIGFVVLLAAIGSFFGIKSLMEVDYATSPYYQKSEEITNEPNGAEPYYTPQVSGVTGKDISAEIPNQDNAEAYY